MLKSGLSSELFLLAYAQPDSGYKYAQIIQNTDKVPNTSKIYPILKELRDKNYLILKNDRYYPNTAKLFEEISEFLRDSNGDFSEIELKHIKNIVESREIFFFVLPEIIQIIQDQEEREHRINALQFICETIGYFATIYQFYKSVFPLKNEINSQNSEFYKSVEQISSDLDGTKQELTEKMSKSIGGRKAVRNQKMKFIELFGEGFKGIVLHNRIFIKMPDEIIKKISILWPQTGGFDIAMNFFKIMQQIPKDCSPEQANLALNDILKNTLEELNANGFVNKTR